MSHYYDRVLQERIWLSEEETKLIKLDEFSRLKKIKQNGFSYLKYPDATNTRYDHSVGSVYWVTKLYQSIFPEKSIVVSENEELRALRISALFHDVGHGPFSHVLERILYRNSDWYNNKPWKRLKRLYNKNVPHELVTLDIVKKRILPLIESKDVCLKIESILTKNDELSLLISGDLDADRLDYLTRDSHYSGLPFGFNVKTIFNEILEQNLSIQKINGISFLCIESESVAAFEQYLIARYAHYKYIAYEPSIIKANLIFISSFEKSFERNIGNKDVISEVIYYIFTKLTDAELLNLSFDIPRRKIKNELKLIKNDKKLYSILNRLDSLIHLNENSNYIKLIELKKETSYHLLKKKDFQIRAVEKILKRKLKNDIKIMPFIPSTLALQTCVNDESVNKTYNPIFLYDYSPILQGLEQKMYLDCGMLFLHDKIIDKNNIINEFNDLHRQGTDLDYLTYGLIEFLTRIYKKYPIDLAYPKVRRTKLIEYLSKLSEKLYNQKIMNKKVEAEIRFYSKEIYEFLQILEFLDVINEDFNISHSDGLIPSYVYSVGEHAKVIMERIKINDNTKIKINKNIEELMHNDKSWWEI